MQTIIVELPEWLHVTMGLNLAISVALLVFKIVEIVER